MARIAPTAVTRPKVGEFTTLSMPVYCGMLKMLVAWARNSNTRDSFNGNILVNAISKTLVGAPMMLLRRASPYCPVGGAANAAVLNQRAIEGLEIEIDCPDTRFGRNVPFVPRCTSEKSPRSRGVNGSPEASVQSPLHCQSPNTARCALFPVNQCLSWPKGNSHK